MDSETEHEHFIPIGQKELLSHLLNDGRLSPKEIDDFKNFYEILKSLFHFEFQSNLDELKETYHIFDPDPITPPPGGPGIDPDQGMKDFEISLSRLMDRANFKPLSNEEIDAAFNQESPLAVNVTIDLRGYSLLHLYTRGKKRIRSSVPFLYILRRKIELDVYERLVIEVKFAFEKRKRRRKRTTLGMEAREDKIYLKYFKNVPVQDIEMIFPDPKIYMRFIDKIMISLPLAAGVGITAAKFSAMFGGSMPVIYTSFTVGVLLAYVIKGIISYRNTVIKYIKNLTQGLYFKNLDNNSGVFHTVMGEAEEEEVKEAMLAYYFLLSYGGMTEPILDKVVEEWFRGRLNIELDFEVEDALGKLEQLGLAQKKTNDIWVVNPLPLALRHLDNLWDNYFDFNVRKMRPPHQDPTVIHANN